MARKRGLSGTSSQHKRLADVHFNRAAHGAAQVVNAGSCVAAIDRALSMSNEFGRGQAHQMEAEKGGLKPQYPATVADDVQAARMRLHSICKVRR